MARLIRITCGDWQLRGMGRDEYLAWVSTRRAKLARQAPAGFYSDDPSPGPCGHAWNVAAQQNPRWYAGSGKPKWIPESWLPSGDWQEMPCPACGYHYTEIHIKGFNGTVGRNACDDVCARAEGANCSCSCGGWNHGTAA